MNHEVDPNVSKDLSQNVVKKILEIKEAKKDPDTLALQLNKFSNARELVKEGKKAEPWMKEAIDQMGSEYGGFTKGEIGDLMLELFSLAHADKRNY